MTTLLIISLLLHGVTFLWILTLMKRNSIAEHTIEDSEQLKQEIEDILLAYTAEMKEENERLLARLRQKQTEVPQKESAVEKKASPPETAKELAAPKKELAPEPDYEDYQPPLADDGEDVSFEQSDTARVLLLAKQGKSAEEIARTLNVGKGEVELLLKFYR
ncbi:hypothetical protein M3202_03925 [Alkalihalobacillus oceani]|uniref:Uncharacterized protein n=1 Tax=Halalkalibacter oceani TaxID=1653776 RepID=A0A9X2DMH3_9BACI|nr:hypothetical protein [Halalkalibacter oceani]MCM3713221.1 hypothetical protein [Halalkalibacter oceani]